MAIKVKNSPFGAAQEIAGIEGAYKSAASASRQKLFESALDKSQGVTRQNAAEEARSLQDQIQRIRTSRDTRGADATARENVSRQADTMGTNALATSALISLAAMTSGSNRSLNGYLSNAVLPGTGASKPVQQASIEPAKPEMLKPRAGLTKDLGSLSARFESGESGVSAIGYDDKGGTSYGIYQIASRVGTMDSFLDYLDERAPKLAERLREAGPANTGGRSGGMPQEWKEIASEDPEKFTRLQHDFIESTHYAPALEDIRQKTGIDMSKQPKAVQEVLWSTAVQHGARGASNIFCKAIGQTAESDGKVSTQNLIDTVYSLRGGQFTSSSSGIRSAVRGRFQEEKDLALSMLDTGRV